MGVTAIKQTTTVDWRAVKAFCSALFPKLPPGTCIEVRCLDPAKRKPPRQFWQGLGAKIDWGEVAQLSGAGYGVYIAPGLRGRHEGKEKNVTYVYALEADLDVQGPAHPNAPYPDEAAALAALRERLPADLLPSIIVRTGNGLQCWWLLREAVPVEGESKRRVKALLKRLASRLDGDPVSDLSHVFRLPGFPNTKTNPPKPVTLVSLDPDRRFSLKDFEALPDEGTEDTAEPATGADEIATLLAGVPQGQRHEAAKRLAGHFIGMGDTPERTLETLRGWALRCDPPWTEPEADKELADIVAWVAQQEAEKAGPEAPPVTADDTTVRQYLDGVRARSKVPAFRKNRKVAETLLKRLEAKGRFLRCPEGAYYFRRDRREVVPLLTGDQVGVLLQPYGLNLTENTTQYVIRHVRTEALDRGEACEMHRVAFFNTAANTLYLSQGNGRVLRLDGDAVTPVENGQDGVYFKDEPEWEPWEWDPAPPAGIVRTHLVDSVHCAGSLSAVEDARRLWEIWLYALFFAEWLMTKPLLALVGPKGSGKTSAFRRLLVLLFGRRVDVTALEGGQRGEEAFIATVTSQRLAAFDNADAKIPWLPDHLARLSTGTEITRRELYTTNTPARFRPCVFVGLTARTPKFRREDVAERTLVLPMGELTLKVPEREIVNRVLRHRAALWGELVANLNTIVRRLKRPMRPMQTSFRVADFADFARCSSADAAEWKLRAHALRWMEVQQADFALEEEPLFDALVAWVRQNPTRGFLPAATLNKELQSAVEEGARWPYETAQQLGTRLRDLQGALAKFFIVKRSSDRKVKRVLWSFEPLPEEE